MVISQMDSLRLNAETNRALIPEFQDIKTSTAAEEAGSHEGWNLDQPGPSLSGLRFRHTRSRPFPGLRG